MIKFYKIIFFPKQANSNQILFKQNIKNPLNQIIINFPSIDIKKLNRNCDQLALITFRDSIKFENFLKFNPNQIFKKEKKCNFKNSTFNWINFSLTGHSQSIFKVIEKKYCIYEIINLNFLICNINSLIFEETLNW